MSERDNQGGNRQDIVPETINKYNEATDQPISENASKILEEIQSLRQSVESLKQEIDQTGDGESAGLDKVVKVLKEEETSTIDAPDEKVSDEVSSFAAKYKEQMMKQMGVTESRRDRKVERAVQREEARREREHQRELRLQKRAEQRRRKLEEDEARKKERRARAKELQKKREIRAEVKRQKRLAAKTAKLGGGVVEAHDTQISTEIKPVARYTLRELLGIKPRQKLREAETEEERRDLEQEIEARTVEARQAATHLRRVRQSRFENSTVGKLRSRVFSFSERHKLALLTAMSLVLISCLGLAGFYNYYTLYEYSYNGHKLGYVKNKDDVYRITDMVQRALTVDKDIQVVIDDRDDIEFKRVSSLDKDKDIVPDSSDEVLKRLTYMGDLNVKAWGVYVDGNKIGSVHDKDEAADVLKKLEARYASGKKGAVIEKAEVQENIDVNKSNTNLRRVLDSDEMVDLLCTETEKQSVHTLAEGETLTSIAAQYNTTEEKILQDNEGLDPTGLTVGEPIVIKQTAPPVTVRITEKRNYDHTIKYVTEEKKTDEMYEGEEEIEQEGENGEEEITERYVSINGKINEEETEILKRDVKKKAVPKIVVVGTAERPPSVGDGVYIWPLESGYTLTSRFGRRWGRLHAGIDLGTRTGNDVLAADGGIVTRAGYFGGYGLCVDVDHQNGQSTRYGHLSQTLVDVGDEVYEGMHIAESGNTGFSTGAHLHFEIHINGNPVDPMGYLP